MRDVIRRLVEMGPIPSYKDSTSELIDVYGELLDSIQKPVSDEEAMALIKLFSPDDPGGINWTIIHIVETAPGWPLKSFLETQPNSEFAEILINRSKRGGSWDR
jgi:hypothetical protein